MQADKGAPLVVSGKPVQIAKNHLTLDSVECASSDIDCLIEPAVHLLVWRKTSPPLLS